MVERLLLLQTSCRMTRFKYHDGACPTNGGSVIQDQQVGTIQSLSNLTLYLRKSLGTPVHLQMGFLKENSYSVMLVTLGRIDRPLFSSLTLSPHTRAFQMTWNWPVDQIIRVIPKSSPRHRLWIDFLYKEHRSQTCFLICMLWNQLY